MRRYPLALSLALALATAAAAQTALVQVPPALPQAPAATPSLTRPQAEQLALRNNPQVSISQLLARAQHQVVRESRSAQLPQFTGSLTAEAAKTGSRIASGSLSDSRLFQHAGGGVLLSQLITDFGRTSNLIASSRLEERAQQANAVATSQDIVLVADQAFYDALQAQSLLQVARQTVATRQATQGQVNQLTQNNLRSTLDLSFANVDLSQAQLLELDAENSAEAAMATLDEVLGLDRRVTYTLIDEPGEGLPAPPVEVDGLIAQALLQRPDLAALDLSRRSQEKFSQAQRDQRLPSIRALGTVGAAPVRPGQYFTSSWDGAVGADVSIPLFNGFLYSAQAQEARLRAQVAGEQARQLRDRIVRDVRTAWLQANNAYRRISVTRQLQEQANQGLLLAQTRYSLGLASMVELSQAQLQQTQAAIGHTNAEYQYRLAAATL
ncbi:MAG TPA: TolC family protein, partial [Acidobacteriaceae bacterium]